MKRTVKGKKWLRHTASIASRKSLLSPCMETALQDHANTFQLRCSHLTRFKVSKFQSTFSIKLRKVLCNDCKRFSIGKFNLTNSSVLGNPDNPSGKIIKISKLEWRSRSFRKESRDDIKFEIDVFCKMKTHFLCHQEKWKIQTFVHLRWEIP